MSGKLAGLVEAARALARGVQGDGDNGIGAGEDIRARLTHTLGKVPRQRRARIVFQRVDDGLQRVFVEADRRGEMDVRKKTVAAEGSRRGDGGPATGADGAAGRFVEGGAAGGAVRRQEDGQQAVQASP